MEAEGWRVSDQPGLPGEMLLNKKTLPQKRPTQPQINASICISFPNGLSFTHISAQKRQRFNRNLGRDGNQKLLEEIW
jgi:hypothetical protein